MGGVRQDGAGACLLLLLKCRIMLTAHAHAGGVGVKGRQNARCTRTIARGATWGVVWELTNRLFAGQPGSHPPCNWSLRWTVRVEPARP